MSYVSNTDQDRAEMLQAIGVKGFDELLSPIPVSIRLKGPLDTPPAMDEQAVVRRLREMASRNIDCESHLSFLGAGIYDHFRPAVVAALASRGEFATAYTPYQPELSQGMLQTLYEFQTLICALTGMELANASMYDAATGLAEAALMATHVTGRTRVRVSETVHPHYREVIKTYLRATGFEYVEIPMEDGVTDAAAKFDDVTACVIVQHPNFFGNLEDIGPIIEATHRVGALAVTCVDPISLGLLKPPGEYDVDIVVGEGQSLGSPMGFGGPLLGLFACKQKYARSFPGRIVGATTDAQGRRGYTMTLRTREQDIRREKATSNICTNETLLAVTAAIHLCALGKHGLRTVAEGCVRNSHYAYDQVTSIPGVEPLFRNARFFKEFALRLPVDWSDVNATLLRNRIVGGLDLARVSPQLKCGVLICVTETKTRSDIDLLVRSIRDAIH